MNENLVNVDIFRKQNLHYSEHLRKVLLVFIDVTQLVQKYILGAYEI